MIFLTTFYGRHWEEILERMEQRKIVEISIQITTLIQRATFYQFYLSVFCIALSLYFYFTIKFFLRVITYFCVIFHLYYFWVQFCIFYVLCIVFTFNDPFLHDIIFFCMKRPSFLGAEKSLLKKKTKKKFEPTSHYFCTYRYLMR